MTASNTKTQGSTPAGTASTKEVMNSLPNKGSAFDVDTGKFFEFSRYGVDNNRGEIRVIRYWPDPRCWVKSLRENKHGTIETKGWEGKTPRVNLTPLTDLGPKTLEESGTADARWKYNSNLALDRIPDEVRDGICRFHSQHHWRLLNLLARAPGFLERLETQPLVVLALAHANYFKQKSVKRPYRSARTLQGRRAVDILRWLDWPRPKSALRLLGRLEPGEVVLADLYRLRALMESGERWISHLGRLNRSALLLLAYHREQVCFRLVEQTALAEEEAAQRRIVRSVRRLRRWANEGFDVRHIPRLRDTKHLSDLSFSLARRRHHENAGEWPVGRKGPPSIVVPPMPLDFTQSDSDSSFALRHLSSAQEIYNHAREMKNCLASDKSYLAPIAQGRGAAYELTWTNPEDKSEGGGTVFVKLTENGWWKLTEMSLVGNDPAPDWLMQKVWNRVIAIAPKPLQPLGRLPNEPEREELDPGQLWIPF
jgi:hypothetical protein